MDRYTVWRLGFLLLLLCVGCGGDVGSGEGDRWSIFDRNRPYQCVPGDESFCRCRGGTPGLLYCNEDGMSRSECICEQDDMGPDLGSEQGDMSTDLGMTPACVPDCDDRSCGVDPDCGVSCGVCAEQQICTDERQCVNVASRRNWLAIWIDDELVYSSDLMKSAFYKSGADEVSFRMGRSSWLSVNFQMYGRLEYQDTSWSGEFEEGSGPGMGSPLHWSVVFFPSYYEVSGFDNAIPENWWNVSLSRANSTDHDDNEAIVDEWTVNFRRVSREQVSGSLELHGRGKGEREGQRVRVEASFDASFESF